MKVIEGGDPATKDQQHDAAYRDDQRKGTQQRVVLRAIRFIVARLALGSVAREGEQERLGRGRPIEQAIDLRANTTQDVRWVARLPAHAVDP